jgi:serine/threonine protein kinase
LPSLQVENLIGEGHFGQVFRVISDGRQCALKLIKVPRSDEKPKYIDEEFKIQSDTNHPNIIKVYQMGVFDSRRLSLNGVYILMELGGKSLKEKADELESSEEYDYFTDGFRLETILLHIAEALDYLELKKLLHQDVKPENILEGISGQSYKLADFGLAARTNGRGYLNASSRMGGTTIYMSPEVLKYEHGGSKPDIFSDVYSLGVVGYFLVMLNNPFEGIADQNTQSARVAILQKLDMLKGRQLSLSANAFGGNERKVTEILNNMLSHDKSKRPDPAELKVRLRQILKVRQCSRM